MSTIIIPARYASSRFPGKPLAELCGKTMVERVILKALESKASRVILATDDNRILEAAKNIDDNRFKAIMTPDNLASGTDRIAYAVLNMEEEDDIFINVQGDEPFIPSCLIDSLIDIFEDKSVEMATAVTKFKDMDEVENPNHVKVVLDKDNFALYFSRSKIPYNRDNLEIASYLRHIGIYAFRREILLTFAKMERSYLERIESLEQLRALEAGIRIKCVESSYTPISIDTRDDLANAIKFLENNLG